MTANPTAEYDVTDRLDVPRQRACLPSLKHERQQWNPCRLTARPCQCRADCAAALTQTSAAASGAERGARARVHAHWLGTDESRPPRSQSLRSRPPTPEYTPPHKRHLCSSFTTFVRQTIIKSLFVPDNNNNNDRLTAFDPGQPG